MKITEDQYDYVANAIYETLIPHLSECLMTADINNDEFYGSIAAAIYIFSSITGKSFEEVNDDIFLEMSLYDAF